MSRADPLRRDTTEQAVPANRTVAGMNTPNATPRSSKSSVRKAHRSSDRSTTRSAAAIPAKPSTRSGISCGRASSPTTRSTRCARSRAPTRRGERRRHGRRTCRRSARGVWRPPPRKDDGRWCKRMRANARLKPSRYKAQTTKWAAALTQQLLARHGVLTREAVSAESVPGGFGIVYPVLKGLEEHGRIRRGYFVAGLGATQFALPGALDLLRSMRDAPDEVEVAVLAATDPANPYGATLRWPSRRSTQNSQTRRRIVRGFRGFCVERRGHRERADTIGRRDGDPRQRRARRLSGARGSAALHVSPGGGAGSIEDGPRRRARAHRSRPHRRRCAARHAHRGD